MVYKFSIIIFLLTLSGISDASLVYPREKGVIQFLAGFGVAVDDLDLENLLTGAIFRVNYPLPISAKNLTTIWHDDYEESLSRGKRDYNDEFFATYRWTFYKALELLAEHYGHQGKSCLLRSICEHAETPFHWRNGLIAELINIILTPSSSLDSYSGGSHKHYISAELMGRRSANCSAIYKECRVSILDQYSIKYYS